MTLQEILTHMCTEWDELEEQVGRNFMGIRSDVISEYHEGNVIHVPEMSSNVAGFCALIVSI